MLKSSDFKRISDTMQGNRGKFKIRSDKSTTQSNKSVTCRRERHNVPNEA